MPARERERRMKSFSVRNPIRMIKYISFRAFCTLFEPNHSNVTEVRKSHFLSAKVCHVVSFYILIVPVIE